MALELEINGTDFTAKWRPYESHWTRRAYMGEAAGESVFVVDDFDGSIDHADLATYKVLRVFEGGFCMFEGRITNKTLGRGKGRTDLASRWYITAADSNYELRGILVSDSHRPEESDRERFLAFRFGYLNGSASTNSHARLSTEIDGTFVEAADLITLPSEDYRDTSPDQIFLQIAEMAAKTFFVFIDGDAVKHLYYAKHDDTQLTADITITDAGTADGVDSYAPDLDEESSGIHDGLQVITGGSVRYGDDEFLYMDDVAGGEADHDKFEEAFTDEFVHTEGDALDFLQSIVASRSNEDFTWPLSWTMRAEHAHRIQAGYITSIRVASADLATPTNKRATQVTHTPLYPDENGDAVYRINADFGLPRGRPFQRHVRRKPAVTPHGGTPDEVIDEGTYVGGIEVIGAHIDADDWPDDVAAGDTAVVVATMEGITLPNVPAGPAAWTNMGTGGSTSGGPGPNVGERVVYKVLTSGDTTDLTGWTFTNTDRITGSVYRNVDSVTSLAFTSVDSGSASSFDVPAVTLSVGDGTSIVWAGGHSNIDTTIPAPTGLTTRATVTTGGGGNGGTWAGDTGPVASWAGATSSLSPSSAWQCHAVELVVGDTVIAHDGPADIVGTPNAKYANFDHGHEDMLLFEFTMDNGASVLGTGLKFWTSPIPFIGEITAAYIDADVDGACVIDVGKGATWTGSHFSSICGGNKPTITATGGTDLTFTDTTLTGWTTDFAVNTRFSVNLDSVTNFKKLTFGLRVRKVV